jgi:hypothetical protein
LLRQQLRVARGEAYDIGLVGHKKHRDLAREAAQKSIVLLQNKHNMLPLKEDVRKVAVIRRLAAAENTGDGGSSNTRPEYVITALQGLQSALEGQAIILFDDGRELTRAQAAAAATDVALLVVGFTSDDEGEFIGPDVFQELISMFPAPNPEESQIAQKLFEKLSTENAVAFPPGGDRDTLTLRPEDEALIRAVSTVYRSGNLRLSRNKLRPDDCLNVSLDVTNTGESAGEEVVQLYVSALGSAVERPVKELKAFTRTAVQAGETKTIHFEVPIPWLAYYDEDEEQFVVETIEYEYYLS